MKEHRVPEWQTRIARELRHRMVVPEPLLWGKLRGGRLFGLKFRRQHPLDAFVADFCCVEHHVVVEVDGRSHDGHLREDAVRESCFARRGYRTLRFTNDEVLQEMDAVVRAIAKAAGVDLHC